MEWINVEEKLPQKGGEYLVFTKMKKTEGGSLSMAIQVRFAPSSGWHSLFSEGKPIVTHWMSLPDEPTK